MIKIYITENLASLPVVVAYTKGLFKKNGINVSIHKHITYRGIIYLLNSGRADAGEIPLLSYLAESVIKKSPLKTLEKGIILSSMSHGFYSHSIRDLKNVNFNTDYIIPVLHKNSIEAHLAEIFLKTNGITHLKINFVETPFTLLEKNFNRSDCFGIIGSQSTMPFLNMYKRMDIAWDKNLALPYNALIFSGRFARKNPADAFQMTQSVREAMDLLSDLTEKDINSFLREINFAEYYPDYSLNDLKNFIFGSPSTANVFNYLPDTKLFEDLFDIVQSGDSFHPDRNINLRIISEWPQVKRDSSKGEEIRTGQSAIKLKTESRIDKNPEFRRRPGAVYRKFLNDVDSLLLDFMEGKYQSRLTIGDIVTYDTPARKILNHALDHFYNVFQLLQYQINRLENLNSILEIKIDRGSVDLQFSEEKYRYLFEYSTEALVIVDVVSGRIIDSNNKFRHFTGFSRTDINQMTIYDLIAGENKLPDLASSFDRSEFAIYLSDYEMVRKDRVMLSVDLNINSHILSATRKYQIQFIDNSEKKEAERLKHEFISNISHELRSPMTNIQGYFQLVASKKEIKANPELRDMMRVIEKNIKRLNLLIDNLLKLESRGIAVASDELEKFSPAQMIEEVLQTNMQLAEDKGLEVIQNLDHSLVIEGIKFEFTQVLTNLFINAVKYTKKGSITVTLEKEKTRSNIAIIKFTDTGIGIDPKYNIAVFERFFRAPGPENRKIGGTGLGLSITQSLLEKIGGVVLLDSTPGVGSTFTINLPLSRE